jgi:hypothetical protein
MTHNRMQKIKFKSEDVIMCCLVGAVGNIRLAVIDEYGAMAE